MLHAKLLQSCLTLCDSMDCSPPGSSVCGILQARILEWVTMPFSRGSSRPRIAPGSPALQADSFQRGQGSNSTLSMSSRTPDRQDFCLAELCILYGL